MEQAFVIHGVPHSLARDGWWLAAEPGAGRPPLPGRAETGPRGRAARPLLLADLLFWRAAAGLSLALFALATADVWLRRCSWQRSRRCRSTSTGRGCRSRSRPMGCC